jgi:hypothetical protein
LTTYRNEAMAPFRKVEIVPAGLGDNAGLVGAASLALDLVQKDEGGML